MRDHTSHPQNMRDPFCNLKKSRSWLIKRRGRIRRGRRRIIRLPKRNRDRHQNVQEESRHHQRVESLRGQDRILHISDIYDHKGQFCAAKHSKADQDAAGQSMPPAKRAARAAERTCAVNMLIAITAICGITETRICQSNKSFVPSSTKNTGPIQVNATLSIMRFVSA